MALDQQGKATLKPLSSALHYFENVAAKDTPTRAEQVKSAAASIQKILARLNAEIQCTAIPYMNSPSR